jgi:tight adherence protein B
VALLARRPRPTVSDRLHGFVSPPPAAEGSKSGPTLTNRMLGEAERSLEQTSWWPKFKEELEIARIEMPAIRIVVFTALGTIVAAWSLFALTGVAISALLAVAIPFSVRALIQHKLDAQRKLFADQLADNLQVIASAMRAGHSFAAALSLAAEDSPEPAKRELGRVVADERLGVPLEDALAVVVRRMQSDDLEQAVLVAMLQRETGGNMAEVVDRVADTIRERGELRRIVRTLTAQGRLSRWVVTALPVGLLAIITVVNPGYMKPLYTTSTGQLLLVLGFAMVAVGSLLIRRIVDFKV